jgi:hypothetical protein
MTLSTHRSRRRCGSKACGTKVAHRSIYGGRLVHRDPLSFSHIKSGDRLIAAIGSTSGKPGSKHLSFVLYSIVRRSAVPYLPRSVVSSTLVLSRRRLPPLLDLALLFCLVPAVRGVEFGPCRVDRWVRRRTEQNQTPIVCTQIISLTHLPSLIPS